MQFFKVAFFCRASGIKKSKYCCHPPFHPPVFRRHSLKPLSTTLPILMNWILLSPPPLSSDPDNPPKIRTCTSSFYGYLKSPDFSRIIWTFHIKTNLGETFFPQVHFYMKKPYKNLRKQQFSNSFKNSLTGRIEPKFCILA